MIFIQFLEEDFLQDLNQAMDGDLSSVIPKLFKDELHIPV